MTGRFWLALTFAVVAQVIPAIMIFSAQGSFGQISDLPEYYAAAHMAARHQGSNIYDLQSLGAYERLCFPQLGERVVGLYVPPLALPWLLPLAWLPARFAPSIWMSLLILSLLFSLALLKQLFKLSWTELLVVVAVMAVSGPLYESLRIGQLAPLLLLALLLSVRALKSNRPVAAAVALSFLVLKPQELLPFLAYLLGARRFRVLAYFAIFLLCLAAISFLVLGIQGWSNYFQLIGFSLEHTAGMQPELNPTVRGQLLRVLPGHNVLVPILSISACGASLAASFLLGRTYARFSPRLELGLATAVPVGLVAALHVHDYDLLLLVPSAVAAIKLGFFRRVPDILKLLAIMFSTVILLPLYVYVHYDYLLKGGLVNPIFILLLIAAIASIFLSHECRLELLLQEDDLGTSKLTDA
jgi:hypothetical protein